MTAAALLDEILRLPPVERIRLAREIWDSVVPDSKAEIPDWHREELDRCDADPADVAADIPWEEVKADLLRSRKG